MIDIHEAWDRATAAESKTSTPDWTPQSGLVAIENDPESEQAERLRTLTAGEGLGVRVPGASHTTIRT